MLTDGFILLYKYTIGQILSWIGTIFDITYITTLSGYINDVLSLLFGGIWTVVTYIPPLQHVVIFITFVAIVEFSFALMILTAKITPFFGRLLNPNH